MANGVGAYFAAPLTSDQISAVRAIVRDELKRAMKKQRAKADAIILKAAKSRTKGSHGKESN